MRKDASTLLLFMAVSRCYMTVRIKRQTCISFVMILHAPSPKQLTQPLCASGPSLRDGTLVLLTIMNVFVRSMMATMMNRAVLPSPKPLKQYSITQETYGGRHPSFHHHLSLCSLMTKSKEGYEMRSVVEIEMRRNALAAASLH